MKNVKFTIEGISPLLMHSDVTANPLHPYTKEMKKYSEKRKKTDEDYENIARIDFLSSCYYDNKNWQIPAQNIEAMMLASSKHFKLGTTLKQAILITENAEFNFSHSELNPEQLRENTKYVDQRTVKVGTQKVIRTRPIFHDWQVKFTCMLDLIKMNPEELIRIVDNAGQYVGLGDYRPRYGRFNVLKSEVL